jgi:hypothetical protein
MDGAKGRGRPKTFESSISAHLREMRDVVPGDPNFFKPPPSVIRTSVFQNWLSGATNLPSRDALASFAGYLDTRFPLEASSWFDYFNGPATDLPQFVARMTDQDLSARLRERIAARTSNSKYVPKAGSAKRTKQDRGSAIRGIYQIVRPYTNRADRFVLECMEIGDVSDPEATEVTVTDISMYSHNQRSLTFKYSGELRVGNTHAFGLLHRLHESGSGEANRCITLFVDSKPKLGGYEERFCLSGIIMRGIKALELGRTTIAVPCLAIKVDGEACSLSKPDFVRHTRDIDGVNLAAHLLLGVVDKTTPNIFAFCKGVFDDLGKQVSDGMGVRTVAPEVIERAVATSSHPGNIFYARWREVVDRDLKIGGS